MIVNFTHHLEMVPALCWTLKHSSCTIFSPSFFSIGAKVIYKSHQARPGCFHTKDHVGMFLLTEHRAWVESFGELDPSGLNLASSHTTCAIWSKPLGSANSHLRPKLSMRTWSSLAGFCLAWLVGCLSGEGSKTYHPNVEYSPLVLRVMILGGRKDG